MGEKEDDPTEDHGVEPGRGRDPLALEASDINVKNPNGVTKASDLLRD